MQRARRARNTFAAALVGMVTRQGGDASSSEDEDENDEPYVDGAADEVVPRSGENEEEEEDEGEEDDDDMDGGEDESGEEDGEEDGEMGIGRVGGLTRPETRRGAVALCFGAQHILLHMPRVHVQEWRRHVRF